MKRPIRTLRYKTEVNDSQKFAFSQVRNKSEMEQNGKNDLHLSGKSSRLGRMSSLRNGFQQAHKITLVREKSIKLVQSKSKEQNPELQCKYILQRVIGKGSHALVYLAHSIDQSRLAIKKMRQHPSRKSREVNILKGLNHPNILQLLDSYSIPDLDHYFIHIVTHYYPLNLCSLMRQRKISPPIVSLYLYQILKGLEYLSHREVMHRDLTPRNILVQPETDSIVIADFGSAKCIGDGDKSISYVCARSYRAPELLFGSNRYTNSVDMWSFGCVAAELAMGCPLFQSKTTTEQILLIMRLLGTPTQQEVMKMNGDFSMAEFQLFPKIKAKNLKDVINARDPLLIDLLGKILVYDPERRLIPEQALLHPYFASVHQKVEEQQTKSMIQTIEPLYQEKITKKMSQSLHLKHQRKTTASSLLESLSAIRKGDIFIPPRNMKNSKRLLF